MSVTYDSSLPTDKDRVRLLIGDTDTDNALLEDEEINGLIGSAATVYETIPLCLFSIAHDPRKIQILRENTGGGLEIEEWAKLLYEIAATWEYQ